MVRFRCVRDDLGLFPWAPNDLLFVDPHLPEWRPEITIRNLHVGPAVVTLRFFRDIDKGTEYQILDVAGDLRVCRRSDAWELLDFLGNELEERLDA